MYKGSSPLYELVCLTLVTIQMVCVGLWERVEVWRRQMKLKRLLFLESAISTHLHQTFAFLLLHIYIMSHVSTAVTIANRLVRLYTLSSSIPTRTPTISLCAAITPHRVHDPSTESQDRVGFMIRGATRQLDDRGHIQHLQAILWPILSLAI